MPKSHIVYSVKPFAFSVTALAMTGQYNDMRKKSQSGKYKKVCVNEDTY